MRLFLVEYRYISKLIFLISKYGVNMNISQAISKRVILLCYEKDLTVYELSKKSGVPKTTIKDIISGRSKNPGVLSIEKLAAGFSISMGEFWNHEIFNFH